MTLRDIESLVLETSGAAESLPDPALHNGRTHILVNTGFATAVWSSTGATPFLIDGVAAASLSIPRGVLRLVQSDGTHWVVQPTATRRVFAATGVSDGAGNVTFTFSPPFASAPVVSVGLQTASTSATEARITALSASSCTVNVRGSAVVVVLGINVLGAPAPLVGATVHCLDIEAGKGV